MVLYELCGLRMFSYGFVMNSCLCVVYVFVCVVYGVAYGVNSCVRVASVLVCFCAQMCAIYARVCRFSVQTRVWFSYAFVLCLYVFVGALYALCVCCV